MEGLQKIEEGRPILFKCTHDICSYIGLKGLRYECASLEGLKKHASRRFYHPCCQNGNFCTCGKSIVNWVECDSDQRVTILHCLHTVCRKTYVTKNAFKAHLSKPHSCIENGKNCEECEKTNELEIDINLQKEEAARKQNNFLIRLNNNNSNAEQENSFTANNNLEKENQFEDDTYVPLPFSITEENIQILPMYEQDNEVNSNENYTIPVNLNRNENIQLKPIKTIKKSTVKRRRAK